MPDTAYNTDNSAAIIPYFDNIVRRLQPTCILAPRKRTATTSVLKPSKWRGE